MTEKLYDYKTFPMFVPIGSLRLKKFSTIEDCYKIGPDCKDNFSCINFSFFINQLIAALRI